MDSNSDDPETSTSDNTTLIVDPYVEAMSLITYKIGEGLNRFYMPIFTPVGVLGNILSFLVMIQKHNRHMSFSLYIMVLAVADTVALLCGFVRYLNIKGINMPPGQYWFCAIQSAIAFMASLSSVFLVLGMTLERFYSIIRPHKAALFNTVKRAKIIISCMVVFSILYSIPHLFTTTVFGRNCLTYSNPSLVVFGKYYFWLSVTIIFVIPFISLLSMNSVIINALHKRSTLNLSEFNNVTQNPTKSENVKVKQNEKQIYIMLLLVTFTFLALNTPVNVMILYVQFVQGTSPSFIAGMHLFYQVSEKMYTTNHGINFFLYVLSGSKFRTDLRKLFPVDKKTTDCSSSSSSLRTVSTGVA